MKNYLQVRDLIGSKYMRDICKVVAGSQGMSKPVSWVHILEIKDIVKDCVDGKEMILTTGIGFSSREVAISFIRELIAREVTALCIETALYYHTIDEELLALADENNFPLLEISSVSRFLDISKGLNTMILRNESKLYDNADNFDRGLMELRAVGTLEDGLHYTAEYLNVDVAYYTEEESKGPHFLNTIRGDGEDLSEINQRLKSGATVYANGRIVMRRLDAFGRTFGYLVFSNARTNIDHFAQIILGRLSNWIIRDFSLELMKQEEATHKRNSWLKDWLNGDLSEEQIRHRLRDSGLTSAARHYFVCSLKLPSVNPSVYPKLLEDSFSDTGFRIDDFFLFNTYIVRRAFMEEGLDALVYTHLRTMNFIVMSHKNQQRTISSIRSAVDWLHRYDNPYVDFRSIRIAVGKLGKTPMDVRRSYRTSLDILDAAGSGPGLVVFDNLYLERIFQKISRHELEEFAFDFLGDLLLPEHEVLLQTLKTYFDQGLSKKAAAERLFIVRQTLYFRLEKIEEILGKGYDDADRRAAIQFALGAYWYIQGRE
jgi:purine catabolism regulator